MKFLIIDDNASARELIKLILDDEINTFIECEDGKYALESFSKNLPDFVLMDIKMNEINGFDAAREILSEYPDAKIFIVSNYDEIEFVEEAKKIGAIELVSKQNLTILHELIKKYSQQKT